MLLFNRRLIPVEIILLCVRWYCKYGISYRDLAEMMQERGVAVDPSTIFRWVQRYAPEIEKRIRPYQGPRSGSWRVDETYVRVGGKWKYLFRAVDKHGRLIAFMLSGRRNTNAAYRFLRKAALLHGSDCARIECIRSPNSSDADGSRTPKLEHAVQGVNCDRDLCPATPVCPRA